MITVINFIEKILSIIYWRNQRNGMNKKKRRGLNKNRIIRVGAGGGGKMRMR